MALDIEEEVDYPKKNFNALYDACTPKLGVVVQLVGRKDNARLIIEALAEDGKAIDSEGVRKSEGVDKAAKRMLARMKKDNVV